MGTISISDRCPEMHNGCSYPDNGYRQDDY